MTQIQDKQHHAPEGQSQQQRLLFFIAIIEGLMPGSGLLHSACSLYLFGSHQACLHAGTLPTLNCIISQGHSHDMTLYLRVSLRYISYMALCLHPPQQIKAPNPASLHFSWDILLQWGFCAEKCSLVINKTQTFHHSNCLFVHKTRLSLMGTKTLHSEGMKL